MGRKKAIVVCVPTLGTVSVEWALALRSLQAPMNYVVKVIHKRDRKGGEIAEVRNRCVVRASQMDGPGLEVDSLFWLDDDVVPFWTALLRLHNHHRDVAAGVYFTKMPDGLSEPLILSGPGEGTERFIPGITYGAWGWPHGLSLVKMDVYRALFKRGLPKDRYGNPEFYRHTHGRLEDVGEKGGVVDVGGTEDAYFFDLVASLGKRALVDCGQYTFGFHQDRVTGKGYPERQWAQSEAGQPLTWDTPEGLTTWE